MFFRMFKNDLKEKAGFNLVLFLMMVMASVLITVGLTMLYTGLSLEEKTYSGCNTSDLVLVMSENISDKQKSKEEIKAEIIANERVEAVNVRMVIPLDTQCIEFGDNQLKTPQQLQWTYLCLSDMPTQMNLIFDENDRPITLESGQIAIARHLGEMMDVDVGDKIRITTQFGTVYEFIVSHLYKSPSSEMVNMLIVSSEDMEVLFAQCPLKKVLYEIRVNEIKEDYVSEITDIGTQLVDTLGENIEGMFMTRVLLLCNDGILGLIVSACMEAVAVFLIAMIFITISFTLKSLIHRQKKEIGIMKAIGVYSLSYKMLFAAKYLVLTIAGSLVGLPIAFFAARKMLSAFIYHSFYPSFETQLLLALIADTCCMVFVVTFIFISLRRMDSITIMDAIGSENRKERFSRLRIKMLHQQRKLPAILFMALNDILRHIKRYAFLIVAYTLALCMVLFVLQGRDSICSSEFMRRYYQMGQQDFTIEVDEHYLSRLVERTGSVALAYQSIADNIADNGIDAQIQFVCGQIAKFSEDDTQIMCSLRFGQFDLSQLIICEGKHPIKADEIAMPLYHANLYGIALGDTLSIEYSEYGDDGVTTHTVCRNFKVTAFFDGVGVNTPLIFMGEEFEKAVVGYTVLFGAVMNCDEKDYDVQFEKMDALYKDSEVRFIHKDDIVSYNLGSFVTVLGLLLAGVAVVGAIVCALMSVLYENIFIEEETADIALSKSMGFSTLQLKMWHGIRMLLLVCCAVVLAWATTLLLGSTLLKEVVVGILRVMEFKPVIHFVGNYIIVPSCFIAVIMAVLCLPLKQMDSIQIWRIRND